MNKTQHKIILASLFILTLLLYLFNPYQKINYFVYLIFPLYPVITSTAAVKTYGIKTKHGKVMLLFAIGAAFIFCGEFTSYIYKYLLDIKTFPTLYDVFYSIGAILLFVAVIKEIRLSKTSSLTAMRIITYIFFIFIAYGIIHVFYDASYSLIRNIFTIYYRIAQTLILFSVLNILIILKEYKDGQIYYPWLYVALGLVFNTVGGIALALFLTAYKSGAPATVMCVDMIWIIGYIFIGYGFFRMSQVISDIKKSIRIKTKVNKLLNKI